VRAQPVLLPRLSAAGLCCLAAALLLFAAFLPALPHAHDASCGSHDRPDDAPRRDAGAPCPEACALCQADGQAAFASPTVSARPAGDPLDEEPAVALPDRPADPCRRLVRIRPPPPLPA